MLSVRIENKKESVMYAVALGCVFLLIIAVTWVYWSNSADTVAIHTDRAESIDESIGSKKTVTHKDNSSIWFFGTLIVSLLLLFGLTFRYYSHREMKQAERRWRTACQSFITRMAIEQANYEEERGNGGTVWLKILNGEAVDESELIGIPSRKV